MAKVKRILLIDDDPISNVITKSIIEGMMVTEKIITAANGKEGLQILRETLSRQDFPEFIFLDLKMPIMDGYEFLEEMKSFNMESKIVILSNSIRKNDFELEKSFNVVEYLLKPISKLNIKELFEEYC